jgi:hypothetical protein
VQEANSQPDSSIQLNQFSPVYYITKQYYENVGNKSGSLFARVSAPRKSTRYQLVKKKMKNGFLVKEEATVSTVAFLRGVTALYCKAFRSIPVKYGF